MPADKMPSGQPTKAARIINNDPLSNGWGKTLSGETNDMVWKLIPDAKAMYSLQVSRETPVEPSSLSSSLFWEHRHLSQQQILSTPQADFLELFCKNKEKFQVGLSAIRKEVPGSDKVNLHPMFGPMRDREFTIWPVRVNKGWVTIILHIQPKEVVGQSSCGYIDREVTEYAIVDPFAEKRGSRKTFIESRLAEILSEGCIEFPTTAVDHTIAIQDTEDKWATGYNAYAISHEFIRRLKVLLYRREHCQAGLPSTDFLWGEFEEHCNVDVYREALMSACAHQTIEKSGYAVRMALDVPSESAKHNPDALNHLKAKSTHVVDEPDENYGKLPSATRNVVVEIPEDKRFASSTETTMRRTWQPEPGESDSDESEEAKPVVKKKRAPRKPKKEKSEQTKQPKTSSEKPAESSTEHDTGDQEQPLNANAMDAMDTTGDAPSSPEAPPSTFHTRTFEPQRDAGRCDENTQRHEAHAPEPSVSYAEAFSTILSKTMQPESAGNFGGSEQVEDDELLGDGKSPATAMGFTTLPTPVPETIERALVEVAQMDVPTSLGKRRLSDASDFSESSLKRARTEDLGDFE
ncbi:hypothetical protein F4819DRAFT_510415 [Hypoxylon fuscum]|nr:hypothetical protein F4819DRAFT_510415 [Hypoxylon fuscum]